VVVTLTAVACLIFSIISALDVIERGSVFISSLLSLDCMIMLIYILSVEYKSCNVLISYFQSTETAIIICSFLFGIVGIGYSSLYYFVASRTRGTQERQLRSPDSRNYGTLSTEYGSANDVTEKPQKESTSVLIHISHTVLGNKKAYNFAKFHAVFTFGSMYLGTAFSPVQESSTMFWMIFSLICVVSLMYIWSLVAPLWLRQLRVPTETPILTSPIAEE